MHVSWRQRVAASIEDIARIVVPKAFVIGGIVLLVAVAVQVTPIVWPEVVERAHKAAREIREWLRGPPPTFSECQEASDVWRKYGRTTLDDWQAQQCHEQFGRIVK